jgi:hypothetical protein
MNFLGGACRLQDCRTAYWTHCKALVIRILDIWTLATAARDGAPRCWVHMFGGKELVGLAGLEEQPGFVAF